MRRRRGAHAAGTRARACHRGKADGISKVSAVLGSIATYILRILFSESPELCCPPQMTGQIDSTALIGLLEQLATVQRAFCDECIVVFLTEVPCCVQSTSDDAYSLELCSRVADRLLVDCESLSEVLVRDLLEIVLICNLSAGDEETERKVGGTCDAAVEGGKGVVHELVKRG